MAHFPWRLSDRSIKLTTDVQLLLKLRIMCPVLTWRAKGHPPVTCSVTDRLIDYEHNTLLASCCTPKLHYNPQNLEIRIYEYVSDSAVNGCEATYFRSFEGSKRQDLLVQAHSITSQNILIFENSKRDDVAEILDCFRLCNIYRIIGTPL